MPADWTLTSEQPLPAPDTSTPTIRVRAPKMTPQDVTEFWTKYGMSPGGAAGIAKNVTRESGGDPTQIGDQGTSGGLYQHHGPRLDALKKYAAENGVDWTDPVIQSKFTAQELERDYPKLRALLTNPQTTEEQANEAFKRVFERPKEDFAVTSTDKFRFSNYALRQHHGQADTDVVYMSPDDYLSLSPNLAGTDAEAKADRSLRKSIAAGDEIEAIPMLDVDVNARGARVTGQDGRHRAMLAKENGVDLIPVAVKRGGVPGAQITELEGASGALLPYDWQKVPEPERQPGMLESLAGGLGAGFGRTVLGGEQLVGKGLEAAGGNSMIGRAGQALQEDAQTGLRRIAGETEQMAARHPIMEGAGELVGGAALPGGVAAKLGGGALRMGITAGALGGLMEPVQPGQDFAGTKAEQAGLGAVTGAALPMVGNAAARLVKPFRAAVQELVDAGVRLTPGQLAGGAAKVAEEKLASVPGVGAAVNSAMRRGVRDFNVAAYNRVLEPVGERYSGPEPGYEGIKAVRERLSAAYDRVLSGVTFRADQGLANDLSNLSQLAAEMPRDQQSQLTAILRNRVMQRLQPTGTMDGQTFKQVESELTTIADRLHSERDLAPRQLGDAIDEINRSLRANLERSNPGKRAELGKANKAWAMFTRVRKAAANRVSSNGVFTPADLGSAAKRMGGERSFAEGEALMQDLSNAGQEVMGGHYPESGTAGRLMQAGIVGSLLTNPGMVLAHPALAAGALAGTLPYTSPGMALLRGFATVSPQTRSVLARGIGAGSAGLAPWIGGALGGSVAAPTGNQQ